jgi:hypothetical protein
MSGYVIVVKAVESGFDVEVEEHPDPEVAYETLSGAVDGYIERVSLSTPEFPQPDAPKPFVFDVWVNEEGLLNALPHNPVVSALAVACGRDEVSIVGNAIITSGVSEDGETRPLTEEQAIVLMSFFTTMLRVWNGDLSFLKEG